MFIQVVLALLVLIGGYQLFGRFLLRYQLSENHLRVTLFGFWQKSNPSEFRNGRPTPGPQEI